MYKVNTNFSESKILFDKHTILFSVYLFNKFPADGLIRGLNTQNVFIFLLLLVRFRIIRNSNHNYVKIHNNSSQNRLFTISDVLLDSCANDNPAQEGVLQITHNRTRHTTTQIKKNRKKIGRRLFCDFERFLCDFFVVSSVLLFTGGTRVDEIGR